MVTKQSKRSAPLAVARLTEEAQVVAAVQRARARVASRPISDVTDAQGHQYVDLVMEGGGVLGVALAGYCYVLEKAGIRFLGLGGTSAGSINALVIAALGAPHEAKAEEVASIVANVPMAAFIDGNSDAREFTDALVDGAGKFKLALKGAQVVDNFTGQLGLHPGQAFEDWLRKLLDDKGIRTTAALRARMNTPPPGGYHFTPCPVRAKAGQTDNPKIKVDLAVIAADISTGTKVEFPRMAGLYWSDPDHVHPAEYVRASMSVPAFFHPIHLHNLPQGPEAAERWKTMANYEGKDLPTECWLVDGGVISNFPIAVFHNHLRIPRAPTFGVKLGQPLDRPRPVRSMTSLIAGVFNAARGALDQDFLVGNPDYKHLIARISTTDHTALRDADGNRPDHNWLNFRLSDEAKIDLFRSGAMAAADFLERFDWERYKKIRADKAVLRQHAAAAAAPPAP
ncbi:patatin-like phospholipase family protein [Piscinibacter sp. Jin2]|uniref:Patatin-like phospholipase family protein n=1 Tax=Aquariibacter lacus TaxID=2801332 RepID=A0A9X0XBM4_9BURK|nr:patatin-like phospholipase family protein [Piscinibacter lacus]MBL0718795.1 patatin-like phospholipase family protein [Piscinibacter lacus]